MTKELKNCYYGASVIIEKNSTWSMSTLFPPGRELETPPLKWGLDLLESMEKENR